MERTWVTMFVPVRLLSLLVFYTDLYYTREWRYARNTTVHRKAKAECHRPTKAKMKEVFCNQNPLVPTVAGPQQHRQSDTLYTNSL
ncbi:hypothetical protein OUZ56_021160 [Daphnia magna]|uniref:Secreted protein n=1 Tax=Daphnia magna TaxID=35525 RepID=A0ABQ9ZGK4_9CRUS|nr:hypothetical protein OUZ56_021160 [Daphnia magna]